MLTAFIRGSCKEDHTMTEQPRENRDDTEGHFKFNADAETAEGDDTEGHNSRFGGADAERAEGEDTEGHSSKYGGA
jgi:hypothetical protein